MKNDEFNNLNDKELLRLTGIKQAIFNKMLDILQVAEIEKLKNNFTKNNLENLNRNKRENNNKIQGILKSVINSEDGFSLGISLNNKIYFVSNKKVYQYDPETGQQNIAITTNSDIESLGVAYDKVYFSSYKKDRKGRVYEYDPEIGSQKIVITANSEIESSRVVLNNKIYFGSNNCEVFEYNRLLAILTKIKIITN